MHPIKLLPRFLFLGALMGPLFPGDLTVPADDARLSYSDYVRLSWVDSPVEPWKKLARFDRLVDMAGKGYQWDNPGTRVRLRTDGANVRIVLYYNEKHISTSARNPKGLILVDGKSQGGWTFTTAESKTVRAPERVEVKLPQAGAGMHDYELVLPYGDSVDVCGAIVDEGAKFAPPTPRPAVRLAAYGDSITHGFTASAVGGTYAFLLAQEKGWQLLNLGLGGRGCAPKDGTLVASVKADVVTVLIGVNDWQGGRPLASFRQNVEGLVKSLRADQPSTPVWVVTPLWVPGSWKPKTATNDLEEYRKVLRETVAAAADPKLAIVEGPDLIDHDPALFDAVAVHPNDKGFAMMASRLAAKISK
ncbi:MAG: lysophospholipase [Spirochaetes bacterium]|nr:lysophospholipase [Spirochaetota bacterium]